MSRKPKKRRKSGRRRQQGRGPARVTEWVGGRLSAPAYITGEQPYRPQMVIWLELPGEFVIAGAMENPEQRAVSFAQTLLDAMAAPMVGPPRRPGRIRIADADLAREIQQTVPGIKVVVAPTPELDRVLEHMAESFQGGEDASYFEAGRISPESIESLFRAAGLLFGIAPWKQASDSQVVRLDIPALGIEAGVVSIIGALGESVGFILFPSFPDFERFLEAAERGIDPDGPLDLGTSTLSLNFERGADLPDSMRREALEYGWPVAARNAYPWVQHRDRDGMQRPLSKHDIQVVTACATSLATFFLKHGNLFSSEAFEPVCESFFDHDGLEVRLTVPAEAGEMFAVNDPGAAPQPAVGKAKPGRNSPCPCGSGKKYKKCCLHKDQAVAGTPADTHQLDEDLVNKIMRHGVECFGDDAWRKAAMDFDGMEDTEQLFFPWAAYCVAVEGKPLVHWYMEANRRDLSATQALWIEAQQAAWLSVWEVSAVEPGRHIVLTDLLTLEERKVEEISGSETLVARDAILARIIDFQGFSVMCGCHPRPLPPLQTAEVVRRIRGRLRRKRAVPPERLRDEKIGRYSIARWTEAVDELDAGSHILPQLQNTDGQALLLTVDHFEFEPALQRQIETALAAIEGVEVPRPGDADPAYVFIQAGGPDNQVLEQLVAGRAVVTAGKLRLETNSAERADALRQQIEAACGGTLRHRAREHTDLFSLLEQGEIGAPPGGFSAEDLPPGVAQQLALDFKEKHYADWADHPLPALEGRTPRQAAASRAGRHQVDVLLKDFEHHEARLPEAQRFDFSSLRDELGL